MKVARTPVLDEYVADGELVVLLPDSRVVALSPVATALLSLLGAETWEVGDLAEALVEVVGAPPEGSHLQAVQALLDDLTDSGLVLPIR